MQCNMHPDRLTGVDAGHLAAKLDPVSCHVTHTGAGVAAAINVIHVSYSRRHRLPAPVASGTSGTLMLHDHSGILSGLS
jgi:hypothetical protein